MSLLRPRDHKQTRRPKFSGTAAEYDMLAQAWEESALKARAAGNLKSAHSDHQVSLRFGWKAARVRRGLPADDGVMWWPEPYPEP